MWVLLSDWPRYVEAVSDADVNGPAVSAKAMQQVAFTLAPYLDPAFQEKVNQGLGDYISLLEGSSG